MILNDFRKDNRLRAFFRSVIKETIIKIRFARKHLLEGDGNQAEQLHKLAGRSKFCIILENRASK